MNDYEKYVPIELRLLVDALTRQARANLEKDGYLAPVAFVGRLDGEIRVCAGLNRLTKDEGANAIRRIAKKHDADFVLWIDEAWMKEFKASSLSEARRIRDEIGGEVRDIPGRIDVVMFTLHTRACVFAASPVRETLAGNPEKYTFGAVEFDKPHAAEGRFMSLLPS